MPPFETSTAGPTSPSEANSHKELPTCSAEVPSCGKKEHEVVCSLGRYERGACEDAKQKCCHRSRGFGSADCTAPTQTAGSCSTALCSFKSKTQCLALYEKLGFRLSNKKDEEPSSKSTLKHYAHAYRTVFGFSEKVLKQLKEKSAELDVWKKHGGLIINKLKLSEHLSLKNSGTIEGFVDLGPFTISKGKGVPCDHGMVILFVPFQGKWSQVIGYFATRGNMKGDALAKVVIEATILAEKSGLFVDFVTCDGASWNRRMWKIIGIQATVDSTTCRVQHPSDASRHLFFISDFLHLIKCLRISLLKSGFNNLATRTVHVRWWVMRLSRCVKRQLLASAHSG